MENSVVNYLLATSKKFPGKIAVEDKNGAYSFSQLLEKSCLIGEVLKKNSQRNTPIAVFLPKSKEMIACFAGINFSENFYVPIDVTQPESRICNILEVLECNILITDKTHKTKIPNSWSGTVLCIEYIFSNSYPLEQIYKYYSQIKTIDTDPAYAIFTSGSTGTPKGVVVNHRGVIDYIDWAIETFNIKEDTVIGNQAPFYFDNSTLDIYLMYATGATLQIIPEEKFAFPITLIDYLNEKRISFVFWVPFVLINIANFKLLEKKKPEYLKDIFFAGEVMPNRQLNYWRANLPNCRYVNLYGPTEITVDCTYYIVERNFADDEPLPIGIPCKNTDILILKDRKKLCQKGETGEICVRGSSLANGYYNNPEKTKDAFIQNPLNSHYPELIYCTGDLGYLNEKEEIIFVGRADSQIKHKGYRIELGEIETAVLGNHLIDEGCVVYDKLKQRITLVYAKYDDLNIPQMKNVLKDKIPSYMLPTAFIKEESMKRNQNGKIDRSYYNKKING